MLFAQPTIKHLHVKIGQNENCWLFPVYAKYKVYGAIATFHIHDAKHAALERGFFVLQRSGDV